MDLVAKSEGGYSVDERGVSISNSAHQRRATAECELVFVSAIHFYSQLSMHVR